MTRLLPTSAFAASLCLALLVGFALPETHGAEAQEITIEITSVAGKIGFDAQFESEAGFAISTSDGVTPATFTVDAEHFTGLVRAKQGASISVKASRGELTSSRTNTGAVRIVRSGGDVTLSGAETKAN
jgi:hypothetical protein